METPIETSTPETSPETPPDPKAFALALLKKLGPANPKCNKCYGRGHTGYDLNTQMYVPCKCVLKEKK